jgi:hypothetical protein
MSKSIKEAVKKLPASRQVIVQRLAQKKITEMLAHPRALKNTRPNAVK